MNQTIETILNHRSVRDFEDKALTKEQIATLVDCAQAASTSSYLQAYSIVGVTDPDKKQALAKLAINSNTVVDSGHFFVFCADMYRHQMIGEMEEVDVTPSIESTEMFMVGSIDAALAAQNTALAAESMGLGICYIGGLRNDMGLVSEILDLPNHCVPLFGLAVGYPAVINDKKPRLPRVNVYHENSYESDPTHYKNQLEDYNQTTMAYYKERTNGNRQDKWTTQISKGLINPNRLYVGEFVKSRGLNN